MTSSPASYASAALERGKDIVMIDLQSDAGRHHARELCMHADVVVESFRPGVAARLGIDAATLREAHPSLVHCSISCFGQDGPMSHIAGHDANAQATAGLLWRTGPAERPILPPVPTADIGAGMLATSAITASLARRERTGLGATLDISMLEAALALQTHTLAAAHTPGEAREQGLLTGALACYGVYRCADDAWMAVAAMEPHFFARLLEALNLPAELAQHQFEPAQQDALADALAGRFATRSALDWNQDARVVDACMCRVLHPAEVHLHPQVAARHTVEPLGDGYAPASPYVVDGSRTKLAERSSASGQS